MLISKNLIFSFTLEFLFHFFAPPKEEIVHIWVYATRIDIFFKLDFQSFVKEKEYARLPILYIVASFILLDSRLYQNSTDFSL